MYCELCRHLTRDGGLCPDCNNYDENLCNCEECS